MAKFLVVIRTGPFDPMVHEAHYAIVSDGSLLLMDKKHLILLGYAPGEWQRFYRKEEALANDT